MVSENLYAARVLVRAWVDFAFDLVGLDRAYQGAASAVDGWNDRKVNESSTVSTGLTRRGVIAMKRLVLGLTGKSPGQGMFLGRLSVRVSYRVKTFSIRENVTYGLSSFSFPRYYFYKKEITYNREGEKGYLPGVLGLVSRVISRLVHGAQGLALTLQSKLCYVARVLQLRRPVTTGAIPRGGVSSGSWFNVACALPVTRLRMTLAPKAIQKLSLALVVAALPILSLTTAMVAQSLVFRLLTLIGQSSCARWRRYAAWMLMTPMLFRRRTLKATQTATAHSRHWFANGAHRSQHRDRATPNHAWSGNGSKS